MNTDPTYKKKWHKEDKDFILYRIIKDSVTGCWNWRLARNPKGYGVSSNRREIMMHRLSYLAFVGEIPTGMLVCHRCDNPSCLNPEHLFIGTPKDNTQDARSKGRFKFGTRHPKSKLTPGKVMEIRSSTLPVSVLCERFMVSKSLIYYIRANKKWSSDWSMREY